MLDPIMHARLQPVVQPEHPPLNRVNPRVWERRVGRLRVPLTQQLLGVLPRSCHDQRLLPPPGEPWHRSLRQTPDGSANMKLAKVGSATRVPGHLSTLRASTALAALLRSRLERS